MKNRKVVERLPRHLFMRLVAVCMICDAVVLSRAQQPSPLAGQGIPPRTSNCTTVNISVRIFRLVLVDQDRYESEIILGVNASWQDPRAAKFMFAEYTRLANWLAQEDTVLQSCSGGPSFTNNCSEAVGNFVNSGPFKRPDCTKPCDTVGGTILASMCCDDIWLPGLEISNAVTYSQDRYVKETITVTGETVMRYARVHGRFQTPMSFQRFPFDSQDLRLIFAADGRSTCLVNGGTDFQNFDGRDSPKRRSDDLSGWKKKSTNWSRLGSRNQTTALEEDVNVDVAGERLVLHISIARQTKYFIWNMIFPVVLTTMISFVCFIVAPAMVDMRLAIVVTLMVALAALQFTVNALLPSVSYFTDMQSLVLISYSVVVITGVESLLVYFIVRDDFPKREEDPDFHDRLRHVMTCRERDTQNSAGEDEAGIAHGTAPHDHDHGPDRSALPGVDSKDSLPHAVNYPHYGPFGKTFEERICGNQPLAAIWKKFLYYRTRPYKASRFATHVDRVSMITLLIFYVALGVSAFKGLSQKKNNL